MAEVGIEIPCVSLPDVPAAFNVKLIGGAELSGFLDFSAGMPTDCSVMMNLMAQLSPALAGLAPILNILGVLKALADFATNPLIKGPDLIEAIGKLAGLFVALTPAGIALTIKGVLNLIITFLECFISQLESVIALQAQLGELKAQMAADPSIASPVLSLSLDCASANADIAMAQAMASLGPIAPLLSIVNIIGSIAGIQIEPPSMDMSAAADLKEVIASLHEKIAALHDVLKSLPG
ncbi:MAG TPA: hypothetical protein VF546_24085 [Pyrinomonadaceae bacterium]|jgi:hypothetical protein